MKLSKRVQMLKPSATLALAAKAKELKAQGKDVISLTVGEPDWDTFDSIKEAGITALREGHTKYTPSSGIPELKEAIVRQTNADLNLNYKTSEVTVTTGGKFTIFSALQSLLDPGDEVIIPAPYWVSYPTEVELAEGVPVIVNTLAENRFTLTAAELEAAITSKTKMLILNSPSNPTGNMYSRQTLVEIAEVVRKHPNLIVMSDDIYNRLVFLESGLAPHLLHVAPDLKDRVVIINGVSKTYSMTGWRLGWALGDESLIGAMNKYQSQSVSCASGFTQKAAVVAIEKSDSDLKKSLNELAERRTLVVAEINKLSGLHVDEPDGAFYVWLDVQKYLGRTWGAQVIETSREFSSALLESKLVATVPGIEFGLDGYLRLSYALGKERMMEAVERLKDFLTELS